MALYLYDHPDDVPRFLPFTEARPIGELRHGAFLLRERVAAALGPITAHLAAAHLVDFTEDGAPPVRREPEAGGTRVFVRSTFVPDAGAAAPAPPAPPEPAGVAGAPGIRLTSTAGDTIGAVLGPDTTWSGPGGIAADWPAAVLPGAVLGGIWEIVGGLLPVLRADLAAQREARLPGRVPAAATVLGDAADLLVDEGAHVEPHVVFDLRGGPIWVQAGAEIRTFSRLGGPLVVGAGTRVVGGQVRESSIGPRCVVHGEISNSVFTGYANKAHDGFLGHSVIGRWVNLGAGTVTSNLKNTYGPVRLSLGATRVETGLTFLGSLIGDHAKTAIGTMLPTGCVVGTGANLFGSRRPDTVVRPFAWGGDEPDRLQSCPKFLQTAGRVLARRQVACDEATLAWLGAVWETATGRPCD